MKFSKHYQNAYVTHDIEKAITLLQNRYGVEGLAAGDLELDVVTERGAEKMAMRLGILWIDNLQIEVIQPVSGCIKHYTDSLPANKDDSSLRLNHIAMRRDNLEQMQEEINNLGLPVLFKGDLNGLHFVYVDARNELGHILEYVHTSPEIWTMLGWPS